jgi:hypothetical protein
MSVLSQKCTKLGQRLLGNNQLIFSPFSKLTRNYSQNEGISGELQQFPVFSIKPNEGKCDFKLLILT